MLQSKDIDTWTSTFLEAVRNSYYGDFARTHALATEGEKNYEKIEIPYPGGYLPGFRLPARGREASTFIFNGDYDSFVEEFYPFLKTLSEIG